MIKRESVTWNPLADLAPHRDVVRLVVSSDGSAEDSFCLYGSAALRATKWHDHWKLRQRLVTDDYFVVGVECVDGSE